MTEAEVERTANGGVRSVTVVATGVLALAPGASLAGNLVPYAVVPAAAVTAVGVFAARRTVATVRSAILLAVAVAALAGAMSRTSADYVLEAFGHGEWGSALGVVLVASTLGAGLLRWRFARVLTLLALLCAAIAGVLVIGGGFGLAAPQNPDGDAGSVLGVVGAAVLLAGSGCCVVASTDGPRGRRLAGWSVLGAAVFAACAAAVLRQLGGPRAGLSPVPLLDAVTVADAARFVPFLVLAVVLVGLIAASTLINRSLAAPAGRATPVIVALAALTGAVVPPVLALAAVAVFAAASMATRSRRSHATSPRQF